MVDPNSVTIIELAGATVLGGGISIGAKIIFDWLKNRNGATDLKPSASPESHVFDTNCIKWKTGVDQTLVEHGGKIKEHEKRLDKGGGDFEKIKNDIAGINVSLGVFAERIKK